MPVYTKGDTLAVGDGGYIRIFQGQGKVEFDDGTEPFVVNLERIIDKGVCFLGPHGANATVVSGWVDMVTSASATLSLRSIPGGEAQQTRGQGGSRTNSSSDTITIVSGLGKMKVELTLSDGDVEEYVLDLNNAHFPFQIQPNSSDVTTKFTVIGENSFVAYSA